MDVSWRYITTCYRVGIICLMLGYSLANCALGYRPFVARAPYYIVYIFSLVNRCAMPTE